MPADEWETFNKDPRVKCKYGESCYQRNPEHHKTYKHPPHTSKVVKDTRTERRYSPFTRKPKDRVDTAPGSSENKGDPQVKEKQSNDNQESKIIECSKDRPGSDHANNTSVTEKYKVNLPLQLEYYDKHDHELFKKLFLLEMPPDFFKFYECLNVDNSIEKLLSSVNLQLIGPFDLLLGKLPILEDKDLYLVHWRFFYDPPEFQAVLKTKGASEFHIGYYRDSPEEKPVFVATNDSEKDYKITPVADNIFGAVYLHLENEKKKSPFTAMSCQRIMEKLKKVAEENKFNLKEYSMKRRQVSIVAKTLHGAGIVVPYEKKTKLGYRILAETNANIIKIFKKIEEATMQADKEKGLSELQAMITYANIAVDECDFGTGLEAGIALFCSGLKELHSSAINSLTSAYTLLNRDAFRRIIVAHLKYRRKGANLSVFDFK